MRLFLRLIRFLKPYRWAVVLAVMLGVVTVVFNIGLLSLAAYLISAAALKPALVALSVPIYLVRLFGVSRAFARYAERLVSHNLTFRLIKDLRVWFYERLEPLAPARIQERRSGDLLSRVSKDVDELENIYLRIFSPVVVAAITTLLTFVLLYAFAPVLAFTALGFLVVTGVGVPLLANALAHNLGRRQLELRAELGDHFVESIQGVQDLLASGRTSEQERKTAELNRRLGQTQERMAFISGLQSALGDLLMNLAALTLLVLTIPLVAGGEIGGVYLAFLALVVLSSFEAIQPLGAAFQFLGRSMAAGQRLFEVVDEEPAVGDPGVPRSIPGNPGLEFRQVGFSYEKDEAPVLEDISFSLDAGSRIAVVGPSGAGKSTLTKLVLRFWDPVEGEVRLGGHDVRECAQEDVRANVGVVAQDTHIFGDTLRANLLLAKPEATDAELWDALEKARLGEFMESLPQGLNSWVGEQGLKLSGGERQRLAIARALLKDAPILILDEPTANLDTITEHELMDSIWELMEGRTVLLITHRLVGLEALDEVLVMDGGRIVERGTHERASPGQRILWTNARHSKRNADFIMRRKERVLE